MPRAPKFRRLISGWLDACDPSTRIALIKLITGGLRVGASLRLAQLALAEMGAVEVRGDRGTLARAGSAL